MYESISSKPFAVRYGLILGVALVVYGMVLQFSGFVANQWLSSVSFIFIIVTLAIAYRDYKSQNNGYMSLGKGFKLGLLLILIAAVLSSVFSFLYISFIDDSMLAILSDQTYNAMVEQGLPAAQVDQAMQMYENYMFTPIGLAVSGILGYLFWGLVFTLITSAIMKNNPPEEFYD